MPIVPTILYRQNSVNDQHQQREEHEVNQFGFICHKTPPLERNLAELDICAIPGYGFRVSLNGCINTGKFYAEIPTTEKQRRRVVNSNSGSPPGPCQVAPTVFAASDCAESVATFVQFVEYARE
jgi:hypothetical protein